MATISEIRNLEAQLDEKRAVVAAALRTARLKAGLSLRQAARRVRIEHSGLYKIERGETFNTNTVARIVKFYERENGTDRKTATST